MKNLTILFFLLLSIFSFSQYKLTYDYTYYYDSLRPSKVYNYEMEVIKTSTDRFYFEKNTFKSMEVDYLSWKNKENVQLTWEKMNQIPYSKLNKFIISNDFREFRFIEIGLNDIMSTLLFNSINWKIESNVIKDVKFKKATANFLGRNWIAYYDENIPINDGPFIFSGLPGLILEIHDEQNYFKWKLTSYKLDYNDNNYTMNLLNHKIQKFSNISEIDFKKIMKEDFLNPITAIESTEYQIDEEKSKQIIEFQKTKKYRFLIPDLWTYL